MPGDAVAGQHRLDLRIVRPPADRAHLRRQIRLEAGRSRRHGTRRECRARRASRHGRAAHRPASDRASPGSTPLTSNSQSLPSSAIASCHSAEAVARQVEQQPGPLVADQQVAVARARRARRQPVAVGHQQLGPRLGEMKGGEAADDAGADDDRVVARQARLRPDRGPAPAGPGPSGSAATRGSMPASANSRQTSGSQ